VETRSIRAVRMLAAIVTLGAGRLDAQKAKTVDPLCEKALPADAANRLTSRRDLQLVPRLSITAAGGTCNYAADGKKMVFLLTVLDEKGRAAERFARYKGEAPYLPHQAEVTGLGDAAFTGGEPEHLLVARKGRQVVQLSSMLDWDRASKQMRARVPREQLIALAKEAVGKL
jgi:hypothetical protein